MFEIITNSTSTNVSMLSVATLFSLSHEYSSSLQRITTFTSEQLSIMEMKYKIMETSRLDIYIKETYNQENKLNSNLTNVDISFKNIVQKLAQEQVELDQEFSKALDHLLFSKMNATPSKKRF